MGWPHEAPFYELRGALCVCARYRRSSGVRRINDPARARLCTTINVKADDRALDKIAPKLAEILKKWGAING